MIRKDVDLNTTIVNIKGYLNKIGIGANGKGITYEATLASAYRKHGGNLSGSEFPLQNAF